MRRRLLAAAFVATLAIASLPQGVLAHPGHPTATPTGPLAGASPTGLGIGLAGLLLGSGVLLLTREDVLTERTRSVGVAVAVALTVIGAVVAFVHF
ncbi:hypothetical protein ACFQFH_05245 [Halobaculum halobium]|uniref:Uncharacterized protein n=1 Tax=Halobaculum halobium TaxID=3032281 RepID=A0ABD5T7L3_9EURY|nr:hypothetical protein [Halobaculum sp. SYNS20]